MPSVHINIGSNLGNSRSLIERAVAGIALLSDTPLRSSAFVESDAWGYRSAHRFVNVGVEIETTLPPEALLRELQRIERAICQAPHRNADGSYADREIDVDMIYYGELVLDTPALVLPHPRMHLREFVLVPLCELSPGWIHPLLGLTAAQLLARSES